MLAPIGSVVSEVIRYQPTHNGFYINEGILVGGTHGQEHINIL